MASDSIFDPIPEIKKRESTIFDPPPDAAGRSVFDPMPKVGQESVTSVFDPIPEVTMPQPLVRQRIQPPVPTRPSGRISPQSILSATQPAPPQEFEQRITRTQELLDKPELTRMGEAFVRSAIPLGGGEAIMGQPEPATNRVEQMQDIVGSLAGTVASFWLPIKFTNRLFGSSKLYTKGLAKLSGGGKQMANGLYRVKRFSEAVNRTQKARIAMTHIVDKTARNFVAFPAHGQFMLNPTATFQERARSLDESVESAGWFSLAAGLGYTPKIGKVLEPASLFFIGASMAPEGADQIEKAMNGAALLAVYGLFKGAERAQNKRNTIDLLNKVFEETPMAGMGKQLYAQLETTKKFNEATEAATKMGRLEAIKRPELRDMAEEINKQLPVEQQIKLVYGAVRLRVEIKKRFEQLADNYINKTADVPFLERIEKQLEAKERGPKVQEKVLEEIKRREVEEQRKMSPEEQKRIMEDVEASVRDIRMDALEREIDTLSYTDLVEQAQRAELINQYGGLSKEAIKQKVREAIAARRRGEIPEDFAERERAEVDEPISAVLPEELATARTQRIPPQMSPKAANQLLGADLPQIVSMTDRAALKLRLSSEVRGSKAGKRLGRAEAKAEFNQKMADKKAKIEDMQEIVRDYAKETLTEKTRLEVDGLINKAKTPKTLEDVMKRIDRIEADTQRSKAQGELRSMIKGVNLKEMHPDYKNKIAPILAEIDLTKPTKKTQAKIEELIKRVRENPEVSLTNSELKHLDRLVKKPLSEMSVEEVKDVSNVVKAAIEGNKNRRILADVVRDIGHDIAVDDVVVSATRGGTRPTFKMGPAGQGAVSWPRKLFGVDSFGMERISRNIDGGDNGPVKRYAYDNIKEGVGKQYRIERDRDRFIAERFDAAGITRQDMINWRTDSRAQRKGKKTPGVHYSTYNLRYRNPNTGNLVPGKLDLSPAQRIQLLLTYLDPDGARHLLSRRGGFKLYEQGELAKVYKPTNTDLQNIFSSMSQKEKSAAAILSEYYNTIQKELINETSLRVEGYERAIEDNYVGQDVDIRDINNDLSNVDLGTGYTPLMSKALERSGNLQWRKMSRAPLRIDDAFSAFQSSSDFVAKYAGLSEPLKGAKRLFNDPKVRHSIIEHHGKHNMDAIDKYLRDMEGGEYKIRVAAENLLAKLGQRATAAVLGSNPFVIAKQPVSYLQASTEVPERYLAEAAPHAPASKQEMSQWSPFAYRRFYNRMIDPDMRGQSSPLFARKGEGWANKLMKGIAWADYQAVGRIWNAVKSKMFAENPERTFEQNMEATAREWERVVSRTQPTFDMVDRSAISRSPNVVLNLATKFTSQLNKNHQIVTGSIQDFRNSARTPADAGKMTKNLVVTLAASTALISSINQARKWIFGKKEAFEPDEFLKEMAQNLPAQFYFIPGIVRTLVSAMDRGAYRAFDNQNVVSSLISDAAKQGGEAWMRWRRDEQDKMLDALSKGVINLMSLKTGIPFRNLKIITHELPKALIEQADL